MTTEIKLEDETEQLFALLLLPDGTWGRIATQYGHGPTPRFELQREKNIDDAAAYSRHRWQAFAREGTLLPVVVTRIVRVLPSNVLPVCADQGAADDL